MLGLGLGDMASGEGVESVHGTFEEVNVAKVLISDRLEGVVDVEDTSTHPRGNFKRPTSKASALDGE